MSVFYHFWRIWLWMNKSGKEVCTERPPELSTQCVVKSNKDIAERLSAEGIEISYSTLTYVIDQYDRIVRDMVCEGYSVKTNNVHFIPELSGNWSMESLDFDPEKHQCSVKCMLSREMQHAMSFVGVKVLGFKNTSSYISQVIDMTSGEINSGISRNGNIMIEGCGIKAMASDGTTAKCVFLMKENKNRVDISNGILTNATDRIVLRVPSNLEVGKYELLIYTYYSGQEERKSLYCQCIEFDRPLSIK